MKKKVILLIRDGWGYRKDCDDNCICQAPTPFTDNLMKTYPNTLLNASGEAVGLPDGYQGNSEVGHMTIGSGRIIFQSMMRINKSIKDGSFYKIPEFIQAIENCKKYNTTLHIAGLLQPEGVHAHIDHLFAILDLCKKQNFSRVVVHVFTDGRDAPVKDSLKHIDSLNQKFKELGFGNIATISGRYYAMDRDKRWDRTKKAYDCIVHAGTKESFDDPIKAVKASHSNGITDEFIIPKKASWYKGIKKHDSFIFFNFRTDRTRQLTKAIVEKDFDAWEREPLNIYYVAMTKFYKDMSCNVAFGDIKLTNLLGEVISKNSLKQLRISETEKYAHITFFFNGQVEQPNLNENRILINSPKVATYDLMPEMSVHEIKDRLIEEIRRNEYDFIVTNFVNGDMVGHTGDIEAITKAVTAVDRCVSETVQAALENEYTLLIFADHGNAEDQTLDWKTSHTINPVPFILVSEESNLKKASLKKGRGLQDIAPTVLKLLDIEKPKEMTGESIIGQD